MLPGGAQCGCASGQACYLNGTSRVCAPAGNGIDGQTCATPTDCGAGLLCINLDQTSNPISECARFCNTDADCQGAGSLCAHTLKDNTGATLAQVCSVSCDPNAQTGCQTGTMCVIAQEQTGAKAFFTDCVNPVGTATQGQSCSSSPTVPPATPRRLPVQVPALLHRPGPGRGGWLQQHRDLLRPQHPHRHRRHHLRGLRHQPLNRPARGPACRP